MASCMNRKFAFQNYKIYWNSVLVDELWSPQEHYISIHYNHENGETEANLNEKIVGLNNSYVFTSSDTSCWVTFALHPSARFNKIWSLEIQANKTNLFPSGDSTILIANTSQNAYFLGTGAYIKKIPNIDHSRQDEPRVWKIGCLDANYGNLI